jgi:hypothetical protein
MAAKVTNLITGITPEGDPITETGGQADRVPGREQRPGRGTLVPGAQAEDST